MGKIEDINIIFAGNERARMLLLEKKHSLRSHAILLYGEKGLGKKTFAKILACRLTVGESNYIYSTDFFMSKNSQLIFNGLHPDVTILDKQESIKIDDIRNIIKDSYIKPNQSEKKVYIIANCHTMTRQAQNALLKILEEPPQSTVFVLTTDSKEMLYSTVLSRVQAVQIVGVNQEIALKYISSKYFDQNFDMKYIKAQLFKFNGNIGRTLESLINQEDNSAYDMAEQIALLICQNKLYDVAVVLNKIAYSKELFPQVVELLIGILENILSGRNLYKNIDIKLEQYNIVLLIQKLDEIKRVSVFNLNKSLSLYDLLLVLK